MDTSHDLQRLRYTIFLRDDDDNVVHGRCCQFTYLGLDEFRDEGKAKSRKSARLWVDALVLATEEMIPAELRAMIKQES